MTIHCHLDYYNEPDWPRGCFRSLRTPRIVDATRYIQWGAMEIMRNVPVVIAGILLAAVAVTAYANIGSTATEKPADCSSCAACNIATPPAQALRREASRMVAR